MARHRVPNLGASLRHPPDPARSPDPEIRRLVSALATLELAPPPSPKFRAELRTQLVAVTPRLVEEGPVEPDAPAAPVTPTSHRPPGVVRWRRPLALAVSVLAVVLLSVGGLVWASQSALPGSALYGVKRTAEGVQLSLASGAVDKAKLYLQFATTRATEVSRLLRQPSALGAGVQADASISPDTAALVKSTLASADSDVQSASQLLTEDALRSKSAEPLAVLAKWAPTQKRRLQAIAHRLPAGQLQQSAVFSATVVTTAQQQVVATITQVCNCPPAPPTGSSTPMPCAACPGSESSAQPAPSSTAPRSVSSIVPPAPVTSHGASSIGSTPVRPPSSDPAPASTTSSASSSSAAAPSASNIPADPDPSSTPPAPSTTPPSSSDSETTPLPVTSTPQPAPTSSLPVSQSSESAVQPSSACVTQGGASDAGC